MKSLILSKASRTLVPLLYVLSLYIFLAGHGAPGGGFIAGLVFNAGFALKLFSSEKKKSSSPLTLCLIGAGLFLALSTVALSLTQGKGAMTGLWHTFPLLGQLGTPVLFDLGVFLVVVGVGQTLMSRLEEFSS